MEHRGGEHYNAAVRSFNSYGTLLVLTKNETAEEYKSSAVAVRKETALSIYDARLKQY